MISRGSKSQPDYDVLIVGGGLVGASLACALSQVSVRVALLDASSFTSEKSPSYDDRAIALSHGSIRILDGIGIWSLLRAESTPIHRIHVSDRGHFGFTRLNAEDHGVDAFGFVTDARRLGIAIHTCLASLENIALFSPAELDNVRMNCDGVEVVMQGESGESTVTTRLLVAADGGNSQVRELAGIGVQHRDYAQRAITTNITPSRPHNSVAYERFTESGPVALLPMSEGRCGLIWSVPEERAAGLMNASDSDFLKILQDTFGRRLGELERCGERNQFPLALIKTREQVKARLAIVGNAANTLHPIAGQGLNLGLRDISALAQCVVDALRDGQDPGAETVLEHYLSWRRRDHQTVTRFTDSLVGLFANKMMPVVVGRNLGMLALDRLPMLKSALVERAMGLSGRQTRLARGMAL